MDTNELITTLTERIQRTANVKAIFGEPVTIDGSTIIPVGRMSVRGGGGGGKAKSKEDWRGDGETNTGMGLGMNINAVPVGYIQVKDGQAEFEPILDRNRIRLAALALAGVAVWMMGGAARIAAIAKLRQAKTGR